MRFENKIPSRPPLIPPYQGGKSYNSPLLVSRLLPLNLYSHPTLSPTREGKARSPRMTY
ncbi:MAG: hypothetical protein LBQ59_02425 [Candidatus Peribacteria bacterium]|nr:hypothetical protein [Candidatus Peribacteria bacterium]